MTKRQRIAYPPQRERQTLPFTYIRGLGRVRGCASKETKLESSGSGTASFRR